MVSTQAWIDQLRPRLAALRLGPAREVEIVEELSRHLEDRYEELPAAGSDNLQARRIALEERDDGNAVPRRCAPFGRYMFHPRRSKRLHVFVVWLLPRAPFRRGVPSA